jgi:hypothetical protein
MEMMPEPSSRSGDSGEVARAELSGKELARTSAARGTDPSSPEGAGSPSRQANVRRLFQDDVFERAARRPLVALG